MLPLTGAETAPMFLLNIEALDRNAISLRGGIFCLMEISSVHICGGFELFIESANFMSDR